MPICYAVSSGEYSDYQVHCIFTTRELAEKAVAASRGDYEIEEFDLDPQYPEPKYPAGSKVFNIYAKQILFPIVLPIDYRVGGNYGPKLGGVFEDYAVKQHTEGDVFFGKEVKFYGDGRHSIVGWNASTLVIASDSETALKVAMERVTQAIALGKLREAELKWGINRLDNA